MDYIYSFIHSCIVITNSSTIIWRLIINKNQFYILIRLIQYRIYKFMKVFFRFIYWYYY